MGLFIRCTQAGGADVGVDLRGDQALVAKEFLYTPHISPAIEQVRGETVTQCVWAGPRVEPCLGKIFLQHTTHAAGGDPATKFVDENGRTLPVHFIICQRAFCQPRIDGIGRVRS